MIGRKFVLAVLLTVVCSAPFGPAWAAPGRTGVKLDYAWWRIASSDARAASVRASIYSIRAAWVSGYFAARGDASRALVVSKAPDAAISALDRTRYDDGPLYDKSLAYYVNEIDALYAQHPKVRKTEVPGIIYTCLSSNSSKADCDHMLRNDPF